MQVVHQNFEDDKRSLRVIEDCEEVTAGEGNELLVRLEVTLQHPSLAPSHALAYTLEVTSLLTAIPIVVSRN